jgi:putative copper export protein
VLSPTLTTWRLVAHVLAATVWVGGQFALAGLVPALRRLGPDATKSAARAYSRVAWPAFAVLMVTGLWNLVEVDPTTASSAYQVTLFLKIALAVASGVAVVVHQVGRSKLALALGGALGALTAIGALVLGILLRTAASYS